MIDIINVYHGLLKSLGFSNEKIEKIRYLSLNNGASAAKPSVTDKSANMIIIVKKENEDEFTKAIVKEIGSNWGQ